MKKYFALFFVAMTLFVAGCAKKEPAPANPPANNPPANQPENKPNP
jgi:hypothetical protein